MAHDGAPTPDSINGRPDPAGRAHPGHASANGNGSGHQNGPAAPSPPYVTHRLRLNPNSEHQPDNYEDLQLDFSPMVLSSLERYLPPNLILQTRDVKVNYMRDILLRYYPESERIRFPEAQRIQAEDYIQLPAAIKENTEQGFRNIMSEPSPGIFTFEMLQPRFCEMLLAEVENFEKWVNETKFRIMRPNTMNKFGVVLDDFGMETMLDKLMEDFIRPMSKVFFSEIGGSTLDAHHGFVLEYGINRDTDLSFHVDDSEVTLNVCLGKQFSGGELFFRGVRCEKHVNTETQSEKRSLITRMSRGVQFFTVVAIGMALGPPQQEIGSTYCYGAEDSVFRELRKYQKDFSSWCTECQREKRERQRQSVAATKLELLRREGHVGS
ncbi:hypothetical protein CASFOL_024354 [Castilleja foliolosa]|uniref:Prolyl 4-hydroxylase alpha subunit domain-containing protein n=1 Tax=Castilleja foliolosa TaxID=1961234 RepID=A0ABD3CN48_9LAMI